jgi:hypothetical protein
LTGLIELIELIELNELKADSREAGRLGGLEAGKLGCWEAGRREREIQLKGLSNED